MTQVGHRYPSLPKKDDKESKDVRELYAQYMLSIFWSWSLTMNTMCTPGTTWWSTL